MLLFTDNEDRKQYILRQAARTRAAADHIKDLKPVILDYDGKVYNKRFDEAIKALGDHETTYTTRAGDYRYEIEIYPRGSYNETITLLSVRSHKNQDHKSGPAAFTDQKRIIAAVMIDDLNYHYAELMREAYELETIAADLDTIMERIATLKKELALYSHNLPYKLLEVFGLKYTY